MGYVRVELETKFGDVDVQERFPETLGQDDSAQVYNALARATAKVKAAYEAGS